VVGLASLLLTLLAFKLSEQVASGIGRQLNVSFVAMLQMLFVLLPMLFIGTSLLTVLAAAARRRRAT